MLLTVINVVLDVIVILTAYNAYDKIQAGNQQKQLEPSIAEYGGSKFELPPFL
jgi:hypothetical protein